MNVLICGVGGQGVILFSDLLANVALLAGLDVKKSEVHGMAQRGGSVSTHVRYGPRVYSPLIEEATADLVVAFEKLEALRYLHFISGSGRLVFDELRIDPLPILLGTVERPDESFLDKRIAGRAPHWTMIPAFASARDLGNARVQNVIMLGAVSGFLEFPADAYRNAIRALVKPAYVDLNLRAFDRGVGLART